jgi:hypothetical protein
MKIFEKTKFQAYYSNLTIYKKFKRVNDSVRDFFKCFFKAVLVFFLNNKKDKVYVAFSPESGLGDLIRQKTILEELVKMNPNLVIDIYAYGYSPVKIREFIGENIAKKTRFVLVKNSFYILKKQYDIAYIHQNSIFTVFIKRGKILCERVAENLKKYQKQYRECFESFKKSVLTFDKNFIDFSSGFPINKLVKNNITYSVCHKIKAGVDSCFDDTLHLSFEKQPLDKFNIYNNDKYVTFNVGIGRTGCFSQNKNSRVWDIKNWESLLLNLKVNLKKERKNIKIVQVGLAKYYSKNADIITSCRTTTQELFSILQNSLLHIDIDGACVHIRKAT